MKRAVFRFYAELNELVRRDRRCSEIVHEFRGEPSVKDAIESMGVPHTEVDLVLADGEPVDFGWRLHDGARVAAYPRFRSIEVAPLTRVRPRLEGEPRFVLDGHLGRLARYLRMAGFDVRWNAHAADDQLARVAAEEERVLVTRDRGLLKRRGVAHGYCVRALDPVRQFEEVVRRFELAPFAAPFRRCLVCNGLLEPVAKRSVAEQLPPRVRERCDEFWRCGSCAKLYWAGSHVPRMERLLAEVLGRCYEATRKLRMPRSMDRIEKQVLLSAPRARVWRALTDIREFGTWFRVKLETGFALGAVSRGHVTYPGYEHLVFEATVERMEPERLLSWRWHPAPADAKADYSKEPTTLVTFSLEDATEGTRLTVVESGFDALPPERRDEAFRMNEGGWTEQLQNVSRHLAGT
jgi:uncharacterized protein with PIN domain/uncharacterized protein YndB with AHSA1/START domain